MQQKLTHMKLPILLALACALILTSCETEPRNVGYDPNVAEAHETLHVVGLQATANPFRVSEMESTLTQLWEQFAANDFSSEINDIASLSKVYAAYTSYTDTSVTITVGFRASSNSDFNEDAGLTAVTIPANNYFLRPVLTEDGSYDAAAWELLNTLYFERPRSSADFEEYRLSWNNKLLAGWLWLAAE